MPQFTRYLLAGVFCAALEYLSFMLLQTKLHLVAANTLAYGLGFTASFLLNKYVVFHDNSGKTKQQFVLYCLLALFNYIVGTALLVWLVQSAGLPPFVAKAIAMLAVVSWNFVMYKKVVYR